MTPRTPGPGRDRRFPAAAPALETRSRRSTSQGIRPCSMRSAREDRAELRALEDEAIREAVRRQVDCGLDVVTDGEFRRWMFMNSFYDAVERRPHRQDGDLPQRPRRGRPARASTRSSSACAPWTRPAAREAAFMSTSPDGYPFKVTFPAPSLFAHPFSYRRRRTARVRVARGVRRRTRSRSSAGSSPTRSRRAPGTSSSTSRSIRISSTRRGSSGSRRAVIDVDGSSTRRSPPTPRCSRASPTTSPRRCTSAAGTTARRGCARARSSRSPSACSASCRTTRSWSSGTTSAATAGSSPCGSSGRAPRWSWASSRRRPPRSRTRTTAAPDGGGGGLAGGMERLAISPQCGFASVMVGNEIDEDTQWRKLELVARVADRLWGT